MARCSRCTRSFQTLDDEPPDHCPFCGYDGGDVHLLVRFIHHTCDAGERCQRKDRIITAGYDAKGRIVDLESGITITVADNGPTFRHNGCPDLRLEAFLAQQEVSESV